MNVFKRSCAIILLTAIMLSVIPSTVFAAEDSSNEIIADFKMNEEYIAEMEELGLTLDDVRTLYEINLRIANAGSMLEIDALMDEYYAFIADTPLALTTTSSRSIYSTSGGTITLDYTGTLSALSNVIYTKVVYLPAQQVVYYQNAMYSEGFLDYLIDEFVDEGISIITSAVAKKIATYLNMASSSLSWLIGGTIGVTVWILQNLDKWDLSDAIDNSTTGKVKLEYYYLTSAFEPYYQEFRNFEPWNDSIVEIPDNYDYTWSCGVFDF